MDGRYGGNDSGDELQYINIYGDQRSIMLNIGG